MGASSFHCGCIAPDRSAGARLSLGGYRARPFTDGIVAHASHTEPGKLKLIEWLRVNDVSRPEAGSGNRVTGELGQIVGMGVKGTNHIPKTNITTGNAKYQGDFSTTVGHIGNRMAVGSLERKALQVTIKDQPERLGTLLIASKLNGHDVLRGECSIELATAVRT